MLSRHKLFSSRVSRRVFVLFLLATTLPIGLFGWIGATELNRALTEQAFQVLRADVRDYGQQVYRQLTVIDDLVMTSMFDRRIEPRTSRLEGIDGVAIIREGELATLQGTVQPFDPGAFEGARSDRTAVRFREDQILLARSGFRGEATLVLSVDQDFLWNDDALPYGKNACVWTGTELMHCSRELSSGAAALAHKLTSGLSWSQEDERWIGEAWDLFLGSSFEAPNWRLLIFQREALALQSARSVMRTLPYVLGLSLVVAMLLASGNIRRTLRPLESLVAATRAIAERRFEQRIELETNDEFSDLANAMNAMATRLNRQFATLEAMSDLDQQILEAADVEPVLERMLARVSKLVAADCSSILLPDPATEDSARLYKYDMHQAATELVRMRVSPELKSWLASHPEPNASFNQPELKTLWPPEWRERINDVRVFTVRRNEHLAGVLVLGFETARSMDEESRRAAQDFADRLAVALAASDREAQLYRRAHYDHLTGLPNRQLLHDRLRQALAVAREDEDAEIGVLFIDLDRFKDVNDSLGHAAGDRLLYEAARRLEQELPESVTVARMGGDEFVVLIPQRKQSLRLNETVRQILGALAQPFDTDSGPVFVSASIGVAVFPRDGASAEELLRKADTAMYHAKESGRGTGRIFTGEMDLRLQKRLAVERDLRAALESNELMLVFQPKVALEDGAVIGAEALLRWNHPEHGELPPSDFIPIAEESDLIGEIDRYVLQQSMRQLIEWQSSGLDFASLSANVSARMLEPRGVAFMVDLIQDSGLGPGRLELELTESLYARDLQAASNAMRMLRGAGYSVAIDDFGTGYSSLSYIKQLIFDSLKIDISFIAGLPGDRESAAIASAIIAMAKTMQKTVVAEGIENSKQMAVLKSMGCDYAQGYWISEPLKASDFALWLAEQSVRRAS